MEVNLQGSIDLLKLENACVVTIPGKTTSKRGVFIPLEENDVFVSMTEDLKPKSAYLGMNILQRREVSQYEKTHYCKQTLSRDFRTAHPELTEKKKSVYLGDFKPVIFEGGNAAVKVEAPEFTVAPEDDLPF